MGDNGRQPVVTTFLSPKRRPHLKIRKNLGKNKNIVMGPDWARNQRLCWRGPAVIYWTRLEDVCERLEILNPGIRWEVNNQLHPPAALHQYNWDSKLRVHSR
jgi:hypothetical protein